METFEKPHDIKTSSAVRILVAEDNPVNQMVVEAMLSAAGYQADIVANGIDAVNAVESGQYDLVLMDSSMPQLDGVQATQKIRALDDPLARIPIIALTANAMTGDREKYLAAGMDDYVAKPIDPKELNDAIERALAGADSRQRTAAG